MPLVSPTEDDGTRARRETRERVASIRMLERVLDDLASVLRLRRLPEHHLGVVTAVRGDIERVVAAATAPAPGGGTP